MLNRQYFLGVALLLVTCIASGNDEEIKKRRLTFDTPENKEWCREIATGVGLCKGGQSVSCFYNNIYKRSCISSQSDPQAEIAKIPALNPDDYFATDKNGKWMSRTEFCADALSKKVKLKNLGSQQAYYKQYCS